jgi:hypothetical protein
MELCKNIKKEYMFTVLKFRKEAYFKSNNRVIVDYYFKNYGDKFDFKVVHA